MTVRLDDETERKLGELAEGLPSASAAVKAAIREAWQRLQDAKLDAAYADAVAEDVAFSDVLAVRLTTTVKDLPTRVPLTAADPLRGHVNTDNIETLAKTELGDDLGALSPDSVMNVNRALAVSLALPL